MPYNNETDLFHIPYPSSGQQSNTSEEQYRDKIPEWVMENLLRGLAGDDVDATIAQGFAVSDNGGLDIEVAAGRGFIDGIPIYKATATSKASLTDDDVNYIYLKLTATSDRDRSFTVEASLSGAGMADAILIAAVTCAGGDITDVDNDPSGRAPRIPQTWGGIPQFRVVAPAGGDYTTLKAAVDAANAGDVIWLCAGTYTEAATITMAVDGLRIIGAGAEKTILSFTAADASDCIDLNGTDGFVGEGFTIQAVAGKTGSGIFASGSVDLVIRDVRITGDDLVYGIELSSCARATARACLFTLGYDGAGYALYASGCDHVRIVDNIATLSGTNITRAIYVENSDYGRILSNTIAISDPDATCRAIYLRGTNDNVNIGNQIEANIVISDSDTGEGITLGAGGDPHYLDESIIAGNAIFDASIGIKVGTAEVRETLVHGNKVATCSTGISDSGTNTNSQDQD